MINGKIILFAGLLALLSSDSIKETSNEKIISADYRVMVTKQEMEKYLDENRDKDPLTVYKVKALEYLDVLKELKDYKEIDKCRQELKKDYPDFEGLIDKAIRETREEREIANLKQLKTEITGKILEEKIMP